MIFNKLKINIGLSKKKIIILTVVILISIIGSSQVFKAVNGIPVNTKKLERENYEKYTIEEGTVISKEDIKIFSSGNGKVTKVLKKDGEMVEKGDLILTIDPEELNYNLDILIAQKNSIIGQETAEKQSIKYSDIKLQNEIVEIAKNKVISLEKEVESKKNLYEIGAISKEDFDNIEDEYGKALRELSIEKYRNITLTSASRLGSGKEEYYKNEKEKIDIQINQIKKKIEDMNILAPIEGLISKLTLKEGDYVKYNDILLDIFNPSEYQVESYVLAKEVKNLKVGMDVYLEINDQSKIKMVKSKITNISSVAEELISPLGLIEKKVKVIVLPLEKADLIMGEDIDVKFITYSKKDAYIVSTDYIFPWKDGKGMWIIEEGKAKIFEIESIFDTSSVNILKGNLKESLNIIIPPYPDKLKEGSKVNFK